MSNELKKRLPLFAVLILFICCKIPHLQLAYYWDESWPYATAIKAMYNHGISLMPTAIDAELSRGHPLFFHALAASWMHLFGGSHISMHSFALLISVMFLIAVYETGLRLYSLRTALLALLLVATQEMFFVQSSFVLFDMLVAFLCFLSIVLYVRQRYVLTALCLAMLFYTKESGLIAGFIIGCDALASLFNGSIAARQRLHRVLAIAVPCVLVSIHFILQKQARGWYMFPLYAGLAQRTWYNFWFDFRINSIRSGFTDHYKYYYFLLVIGVAVVYAIKQKQFRVLSILLPAICIYYFVDDMRTGRLLPPIPFFIVFIASVVFFLYEYSRLFASVQQKKLFVLLGLFILSFLIFSGMNFFTPRYLLASIVPAMFISAAALDVFIQRTWQWLIYPVAGTILFVSFWSYATNDSYGDTDHLFVNGIKVHQDVVDYFETNNLYDKQLGTGLFLQTEHLSDPSTGYLHSAKTFKVKWDINDKTDYVIFDNIEYDPRYEGFKKDPAFELVKRMPRGSRWAEVYKRK